MTARGKAAPAGRGRRLLAVGVAVLAVVWLAVNKPVEGPTLLVLSRNHGVTAADLLSLVAFVVALVLWVAPRRPRGGRRAGDAPEDAGLSTAVHARRPDDPWPRPRVPIDDRTVLMPRPRGQHGPDRPGPPPRRW